MFVFETVQRKIFAVVFCDRDDDVGLCFAAFSRERERIDGRGQVGFLDGGFLLADIG